MPLWNVILKTNILPSSIHPSPNSKPSPRLPTPSLSFHRMRRSTPSTPPNALPASPIGCDHNQAVVLPLCFPLSFSHSIPPLPRDCLPMQEERTMPFRPPFLPLIFFSLFFGPISTFDDMPRLDPSISTQSPHVSHSSDSCVGQCAFLFIDQMSTQLGSEKSAGLLNLNYNDFLAAFANSSSFESFCKLYHQFNFCFAKCPSGFMQEQLTRSAEIVDHFCVWNYKAILERFGCLAGLDRVVSRKCLRSCTGLHDAVTSLMQNFKHLTLNGDTVENERYMMESCEYVTCSLHCDVPAIYHLCGVDTAELVVNLTRKSFGSMQRMALDSGTISKWPQVCADIHNYTLPKAPSKKSASGAAGKKRNGTSSTSLAWELTIQNGTRIEAEQEGEEAHGERGNGTRGRVEFVVVALLMAAMYLIMPLASFTFT